MARKSKRVDFLTVIVLMSMPAFLLTVLVMLSLAKEKPPAAKLSLVELKSGSQTPDIKNFGDDGFGSSSSKRGLQPSSLALGDRVNGRGPTLYSFLWSPPIHNCS